MGIGTRLKQLRRRGEAGVASESDSSVTFSCPLCGEPVKRSAKQPTCPACFEAIHQEAKAWQERDYLARWLSTRVDAHGIPLAEQDRDAKTIVRLVVMARERHADWLRPPEPMTYDARVKVLTERKIREREVA